MQQRLLPARESTGPIVCHTWIGSHILTKKNFLKINVSPSFDLFLTRHTNQAQIFKTIFTYLENYTIKLVYFEGKQKRRGKWDSII